MTTQNKVNVIFLFLLSFFLFADQNLIGPNLSSIANDFGFSTLEKDVKLGGEISLAFWLIGGSFSLVFGFLSDKHSRKRLLLYSVLLAETACLLTGFVENYNQFFWLRSLTGIGIGAIIPITYSLIGDFFPAEKRSLVSGLLSLVVGLGIVGGQLLAGIGGEQFGWKACFIIVSVPNFFVLIFYYFFGKDPKRGSSDRSLVKPSETKIITIFKIKTNLLVFIQGAAGSIPWAVFFVFLVDYLAYDIGFSVKNATIVVSVIGVSAIFGSFFGGVIGNIVFNKNPKFQPLFSGLSTLIGTIPTAIIINLEPGTDLKMIYAIIMGVFSGFFITVTAPNMKAVLMNVNGHKTRGKVFALYNLADDLGRGFGPVIISFLILAFGRTVAFNIANGIWVFCAVALFFMIKTYPVEQKGT